MTRCKANPCCNNERNCVVPMPQHQSGFVHLNEGWAREEANNARVAPAPAPEAKSIPTFATLMAGTEEATEELIGAFTAAAVVFNAKLNAMSDGFEAMTPPQLNAWAAYLESRMEEAQAAISKVMSK